MKAKIEFSIYDNFLQYVTPCTNGDYAWDYNLALEVLNKQLNELIQKNKLTFLYEHRRIQIITPIELCDTGNIFTYKWEGVGIWCNINCSPSQFNSKKLKIGKCPDNFIPQCICY